MKKLMLLVLVLVVICTLPIVAFAGAEGGFSASSMGTFPKSETIQGIGTTGAASRGTFPRSASGAVAGGISNIITKSVSGTASMSVAGTVTHGSVATFQNSETIQGYGASSGAAQGTFQNTGTIQSWSAALGSGAQVYSDSAGDRISWSDNFNRSNQDPMTGNWTADYWGGGTKLSDSYVVSHSSPKGVSYWNANTPNIDQFSQVVVIGEIGFDYSGVFCRLQPGLGTGYLLYTSDYTHLKVYRYVGGSGTELASYTIPTLNSAVSVIRLEVSGYGETVTLKTFLDGVQVDTDLLDTSSARIVSAGRLGIQAGVTNGLDNWTGGNLRTSELVAAADASSSMIKILPNSLTFSTRGFSSTSASGTIYPLSTTMDVAAGMGSEQGGGLLCSVTFGAGATSGGGSLALSFPSLAFLGGASASGSGRFNPFPTASLGASGALTGDSLGNLSSSVSVPVLAQAFGETVSPSGGFDVAGVTTFNPSPVILPVASAAGEGSMGKLYSAEIETVAAGFSTSMPGANTYDEYVSLQTGGSTSQSSLGTLFSSLTYLVGDYFQGPQNPYYPDTVTMAGAAAFSMIHGGTHNVTPFAPFSDIARTTASSQVSLSRDETLSASAAATGAVRETTYPGATADVASAITASGIITSPSDSTTLSASAGASSDHYLTQPETVAFGAGATQTVESNAIQPETVALAVGASDTYSAENPYGMSPFSAVAGFDTTATGTLPAIDITASSSAAIQAEAQYTVPDQRRVEQVYAGATASATRDVLIDSSTFSGIATIQPTGSMVYNVAIAMAVGGASSPGSQAVQGRDLTISGVARENSLHTIPIPNAVMYGIQ